MANEEDTDVGSLIAFGAKALFAEEEAAVKHFTSDDVDGIIQRAETAEDVSETEGGGMKFDYAEIYDGLRDGAEPAEGDGTPAAADEDFWDAIVKRAAKEKEAQEEAGRRQRRTKKVRGLCAVPDAGCSRADGLPAFPRLRRPTPTCSIRHRRRRPPRPTTTLLPPHRPRPRTTRTLSLRSTSSARSRATLHRRRRPATRPTRPPR